MPAKRAAVGSPAAPAGKRVAVDPVVKRCGVVVKALKQAKDLPPTVVEMLKTSLTECLSVYEDQRHAYQAQVVEWTGAALASIDAGFEGAITETTAAVAKANEEQAAATAAVAAKEAEVGVVKETKAAHKEAHGVATAASEEAKAVLAAAEGVQAEGDKELEAVAAKKAALEVCEREGFQPLVDGTVSGVKKVNALVAAARKFVMDESLLLALERALRQAVAARSDFDALVLAQFKVAVDKLAAGFQATLEEGQPGKDARAADVAAAKAAADAKAEGVAAAKTTLQATSADLSAKETELKELRGAAKASEVAVTTATEAAEAATVALADFRDGPLATFAELRSRSTPAPPPAPPAEEATPAVPVAEATPAEAIPEASAPAEIAAAAKA